MAGKQQFTAKQVCDASEGTGGIMALVAKKLGCDRSTISRYARRYKTVRDALRQADDTVTDIAEAKAAQLINAEYWPAIKYRLTTKGKDRGYVERQEITGAKGGPMIVGNVQLTAKQQKRAIAQLAEIHARTNSDTDIPLPEP